MSCLSEVQAAGSAPAALKVIAVHIDKVLSLLELSATSPKRIDEWTGEWSQPKPEWDNHAAHIKAATEYTASQMDHTNGRVGEVDELRNRLLTADDPGDRQAITAQIRILTDTGRPGPSDDLAAGNRARRTEIADGEDVELVPVSVERQIARIQWAHSVELHQYLEPTGDMETEWTAEMAATAFAKGGPMWLYLGNRKAVMMLPNIARAWLVAEVEHDSPKDAHELSRDILKSDESADQDITTTAINAMSSR